MPELTPRDRLQPALLDRLTDEEPDKRTEPRERRVMTEKALRAAVRRDLVWLLNTTRVEVGEEFGALPYVARSVINFGLPALSGLAATSLDPTALERAVRQAIVDFEPRILPTTVEVRALIKPIPYDFKAPGERIVGVEIRGYLWAQPTPLEFLARTRIDIETGRVSDDEANGAISVLRTEGE